MPRVRLHVIPIGGAEPFHIASPNCFCSPVAKALHDVAPQYVPELMAHNAQDKRERWEEITGRPRDPGSKWVHVGEEVP